MILWRWCHTGILIPSSSIHFFPLWLKAFHFKAQNGLLIESMPFIYDNPIHTDTHVGSTKSSKFDLRNKSLKQI